MLLTMWKRSAVDVFLTHQVNGVKTFCHLLTDLIFMNEMLADFCLHHKLNVQQIVGKAVLLSGLF